MAGNNIKMNVSEVQTAITNFETRKNEFQDSVNTIASTMLFLASSWTGTAEQTFQRQITDMLKNVKTIMESIEGANARLKLAISSYEETENAQSAALNALDEGASSYVV